MDILNLIRTRRSIRKFTDKAVPDDVIEKIIDAGRWAPSGLNNQPWKFAIVRDKALKKQISQLTRYGKIVLGCNVLIAVFLDHTLSYDRTKDAQAIGACIQNMLLTIHAMGLGAVWLGEILKNGEKVRDLVEGSADLELMAVIAAGFPAEQGKKGHRRESETALFFRR